MIDAPLPGSRSTSRSTLAPFVIACSAWVRCVEGSPCALTIVCEMPAAVKAASRYLRSNCSQRTDDCVSGSRTAISPLPTVVAAFVLLPPLLLLLFEEPQPAATRDTNPSASTARILYLLTSLLLSWFHDCLCELKRRRSLCRPSPPCCHP